MAGSVLQDNDLTAPTYSTATYPSVATGTGKILRADGTNWVATTATFPDTAGTSGNVLTSNGTNWSSTAPAASGTVTSVSGTTNQVSVATGTTTPVISLVGPYTPATYTAHGVLVGEGTSSIVALSVGATGTVLTGSTGADPVFSATPSVTSITLSGGTALSNYAEGTFTPTMFGTSTAGSPTYGAQVGRYTRIGRMVFFFHLVDWSAKNTAAGDLRGGGLPFTAANIAGVSPAITCNLSALGDTIAIGAALVVSPVVLLNTTSFAINSYNGTTGALAAVAVTTVGSWNVVGQYEV